jgi:hypothetical protein
LRTGLRVGSWTSLCFCVRRVPCLVIHNDGGSTFLYTFSLPSSLISNPHPSRYDADTKKEASNDDPGMEDVMGGRHMNLAEMLAKMQGGRWVGGFSGGLEGHIHESGF